MKCVLSDCRLVFAGIVFYLTVIFVLVTFCIGMIVLRAVSCILSDSSLALSDRGECRKLNFA